MMNTLVGIPPGSESIKEGKEKNGQQNLLNGFAELPDSNSSTEKARRKNP